MTRAVRRHHRHRLKQAKIRRKPWSGRRRYAPGRFYPNNGKRICYCYSCVYIPDRSAGDITHQERTFAAACHRDPDLIYNRAA